MSDFVSPKCPYEDKECPKIKDLENEIEKLRTDIKTSSYYLYIIIGMIAVNWGIEIW